MWNPCLYAVVPMLTLPTTNETSQNGLEVAKAGQIANK